MKATLENRTVVEVMRVKAHYRNGEFTPEHYRLAEYDTGTTANAPAGYGGWIWGAATETGTGDCPAGFLGRIPLQQGELERLDAI